MLTTSAAQPPFDSAQGKQSQLVNALTALEGALQKILELLK
jgi:hypothetical protein